jgi:CheY-like chemotaxis protein
MGRSNPNNAVVTRDGSRPPPAACRDGEARILVIDDELLLGRTLSLAFQGQHEVIVCTSGREALERLSYDARFDLILCDLMMPDMSGMTVHDRIAREHPELTERLVFMTGGAFTDDARAFLDEHPHAQLDKPFDIAQVEKLLERSVRQRARD